MTVEDKSSDVQWNGAPICHAISNWAAKLTRWNWSVESYVTRTNRTTPFVQSDENVLYRIMRTRGTSQPSPLRPKFDIPHEFGVFGSNFESDHFLLVDRKLACAAAKYASKPKSLRTAIPQLRVIQTPEFKCSDGLFPFDFGLTSDTKLDVANAQVRSANVIRTAARHLYLEQSFTFGDSEAICLIEQEQQRVHNHYRARFGAPTNARARKNWIVALVESQAIGIGNGATHGTSVYGDVVNFAHLHQILGRDVSKLALHRDVHDLARAGQLHSADQGNVLLPKNWTVPLELAHCLAAGNDVPSTSQLFTLFEVIDPVSRVNASKSVVALRRFADLATPFADTSTEYWNTSRMPTTHTDAIDDGFDFGIGL